MADEHEHHENPPPRIEGGAAILPTAAERDDAYRRAKEAEEREYKKEQRSLQRRMLWTQIGLVFVALIGGGFTYWQVQIAQQSADTADRSVLLAQKSERDARLVAEKSLQGSIDALEQDQRAWVGPIFALPPQFTDGSRRVYIKAGEKLAFGFDLANTGKTPAQNLTAVISAHLYRSDEKFVPDYRFHHGKPAKTGTITELFPGVRMEVLTDASGSPATQGQVDSIMDGKSIFYVYGKITYKDVFEKQHETKFCSFVEQDLLALVNCDTYNEAN